MKQVILSTILSFSLFSMASIHGKEPSPPTIEVVGQAVITKPADQVSLSIGVVTEEKTADTAMQKNKERMQSILSALRTFGLTEENFETGNFSITPIHSTPPKNPPINWTPSITGYQVNNALIVKSDQVDKAGDLIDSVNQAGANRIQSIRFELQDPSQYRSEVITLATKNAKKDAETLAKASSVGLGQLRSLKLNQAPPAPIYKNAMMLTSRNFEGTPIESGEIEVRASVTALYTIEQ